MSTAGPARAQPADAAHSATLAIVGALCRRVLDGDLKANTGARCVLASNNKVLVNEYAECFVLYHLLNLQDALKPAALSAGVMSIKQKLMTTTAAGAAAPVVVGSTTEWPAVIRCLERIKSVLNDPVFQKFIHRVNAQIAKEQDSTVFAESALGLNESCLENRAHLENALAVLVHDLLQVLCDATTFFAKRCHSMDLAFEEHFPYQMVKELKQD